MLRAVPLILQYQSCRAIFNQTSIFSHPLTIQFCYIQPIPRITFWVSQTILLWGDSDPLNQIAMNGYIPVINGFHRVCWRWYMCACECVCVCVCSHVHAHKRKWEQERERMSGLRFRPIDSILLYLELYDCEWAWWQWFPYLDNQNMLFKKCHCQNMCIQPKKPVQ